MSVPTNYEEAITEIRDLMTINRDLCINLRALAASHPRDPNAKVVAEVSKAFDITADRLRDLSTGIANLALANSNEDFSKVLAALAK